MRLWKRKIIALIIIVFGLIGGLIFFCNPVESEWRMGTITCKVFRKDLDSELWEYSRGNSYDLWAFTVLNTEIRITDRSLIYQNVVDFVTDY